LKFFSSYSKFLARIAPTSISDNVAKGVKKLRAICSVGKWAAFVAIAVAIVTQIKIKA
jgi:hypothetical protein